MLVGVLKTDHTQLSLAEREQVYFSQTDKARFLVEGLKVGSLDELVIVSTCNRTELVFSGPDIEQAADELRCYLSVFFKVSADWISQKFEFIRGDAAIMHLFGVCSGIHSMVFGENEILGQVKDAYYFSLNAGATRAILNKVFQMAIAVGKRVKDETALGKGAYSVSSIAIDWILERHDSFLDARILVIGAGDTGYRCIKKLMALGHRKLTIMNRTFDRAEMLAQQFDILASPMTQLDDEVAISDIVIVATLSPTYLVLPGHVTSNQQKMVIDLGVPRNVDPRVSELKNAHLITIDHLNGIAEQNLIRRRDELPKIRRIFDEELVVFHQWHQHRRPVSV